MVADFYWDDKELFQKLFMTFPKEWRHIIWGNEDMFTELCKATAEISLIASKGFTIYPPPKNALEIFRKVLPQQIKVVILGQDPYPNDAANGVAFAGTKIEPSLRNILRCMQNRGLINEMPASGNLDPWLKQGVFLTNTAFTVAPATEKVHKFWHNFTKLILTHIENSCPEAIFILLGNDAQKIASHISPSRCRTWGHPSPIARANRNIALPEHFINCDAFDNLCINWELYNGEDAPSTGSKFDIYRDDAIYLFTDGATKANGKPGAIASWAYRLVDAAGAIISEGGALVVGINNNQTAELSAILFGLRAVEAANIKNETLMLVSDSKYALGCVFEWYEAWLNDPQRMKDKKHLNIIEPAYNLTKKLGGMGITIIPNHVRGHRSKPLNKNERFIWGGNDAVDKLASSLIR